MKRQLFGVSFSSLIFFIIVFCFLTHTSANAYGPKEKRFGLGIVAGDPTGITGKGYLSNRLAVDAHVGWSLIEESFSIIGDVTYDFLQLPVQGSTNVKIPFYVGVGGKIGVDQAGKNDGKTLFGIRVPIGLAFQWENHPIEVFIEIAPGIELIPETEFDLTGGIGARFYF